MTATPFRPADHDRAIELAALRLDEPLEPADAAWLDEHLGACDDCSAIAAAYDTDAQLFAPLREAAPLPPRDLWARTAAAIDAEARAGARRPARVGRRLFGLPLTSLAPVAAIGVVGIVVGSALLNGATVRPGPGPGGPEPTAIAVAPEQIAVVTRDRDGHLQVLTVAPDEVCPIVADGCQAAQPSFEASKLPPLDASINVDAILSPKRDRVVIVQRDPKGVDGVFVVPVKVATAATAPDPTEATAATDAPRETATAIAAATDRPTPTEPTSGTPTPATETPATSDEPSATDSAATDAPPATGTPTATDEPSPGDTPAATPEATNPPTGTPPATQAPEATDEPAPTPTIEVTPRADGAIEIARNVVVVGNTAAYNPDGSRFAFTARPADGSAGPDVYVWDTTDTRARAVTTDHRSLFAGWDEGDLLVSRVVDGSPRTIAVNPRTGAEKAEHGNRAWLPAVAPDGSAAVWWDGTVRLAADGVTWVPDHGRLVVGGWPDGGDTQTIARGDVATWDVQWSPSGEVLAVWTAAARSDEVGRLSLYGIDPATGLPRAGRPLLDGEPAYAGFTVGRDRLAYTAPAGNDDQTVWVVDWAVSPGRILVRGGGAGGG